MSIGYPAPPVYTFGSGFVFYIPNPNAPGGVRSEPARTGAIGGIGLARLRPWGLGVRLVGLGTDGLRAV